MTPGRWLLVAAVFVGVVIAALLLDAAPPIVVAGVLLSGAGYAYVRFRPRARPERGDAAGILGLRREPTDPFGIAAYPLALLSRVDRPEVGEVLWGRWRSIDVQVFDLTFAAPSLSGDDAPRATYTCAMAAVPVELPTLVLEPQAFATEIRRPAPAEALDLGAAGSDLELNVWCDDRSFADTLLDPPTLRWLRSLEDRWGLELSGRIAVVYGRTAERPETAAILETLRRLHDRAVEARGRPGA